MTIQEELLQILYKYSEEVYTCTSSGDCVDKELVVCSENFDDVIKEFIKAVHEREDSYLMYLD